MRVLGAIVHQQQDLRVRDRLREEIEERLGLIVDPVQILEDHHQRLVEALAQQNAFDRIERPPPLHLPVHLRQRIVVALHDSEQTEQVWPRVFQGRIERDDPSVDLLAPRPRVVLRRNTEITVQQVEHRKVC